MQFNRTSGQFSTDSGETIATSSVEAKISEFQAGLSEQFDRTTSQLISNKISLAEFERSLAEQTKTALLQVTVVAAGGQENISQSPYQFRYYGGAGFQLRRRYGAIANLAVQISEGKLSEAQIRDRVRRVSRDVYSAYHRATLTRKITEQNHNEGQRVLDPLAQHCDSCPAYRTDGMVPISEIIPIGHACLCGGYCRCQIMTRFNPQRAIAELQGGLSLDQVLQDAQDKQNNGVQGPTLKDVENLLLRKRGVKRPTAVGFG